MRKNIPAIVEIHCDCCKRQIGVNGATYKTKSKLKMEHDALDAQGYACASANYEFDLCDTCSQAMADAINDIAASMRVKHAPAPGIA